MATYEEIMAKAKEMYESGDAESAKRLAEIALKQKPAPQTNMVEQGLSGVNEGLSSMLGAPVDLATGAINMGTSGINAVTGSEIPKIKDPFLGANTFNSMLKGAGSISDTQPQTTAQRYGRSIGREVGEMAIPAGATASKAQSIARLLGLEAASAVGSGGGSQVARDVAPNSPMAEIAGSLMGGFAPIGASKALRKSAKAPTIEELLAGQKAAYGRVEKSGAQLSPQAGQRIAQTLNARIAKEGVPEFLPRLQM